MTRTTFCLSLPAFVSALALVACIPPQSDPEGDTDAAEDESTGGREDLTTGADAPNAGSDENDGTDDPGGPVTGDPADDDGDADDDGGSGGCDPSTHACLDSVPVGWAGPTALLKTGVASPTPACPAPWVEVFDHDLFSGFDDGGDATCTCGCAPQDLACEVEATLSYWDPPFGVQQSSACNTAPLGSLTVSDGVTIGNPPWVGNLTAAWRVESSTQTLAGSCAPYSSQSVPEASFSLRVTACELGEDAVACESDGLCMPLAPADSSGEVCIFRDGQHECPTEGYTDRKVYYRDIDDTRGCPTCTCGEVSGPCTNESFTPGSFSGVPPIQWDNETIPLDGACELVVLQNGQFNAMLVDPGEPVANGAFATCGEIAGTEDPIGQAEPAGAVTFCCAAE